MNTNYELINREMVKNKRSSKKTKTKVCPRQINYVTCFIHISDKLLFHKNQEICLKKEDIFEEKKTFLKKTIEVFDTF